MRMSTISKSRISGGGSAFATALGATIRERRGRLGLSPGELGFPLPREAPRGRSRTRAALAGERYTKAYISALENGLAKPSMAALNYLAGRLGIPVTRLLADEASAWTRLEVDLRLAAG